MMNMVSNRVGEEGNVDVDDGEFTQDVTEDFVHETLKHCR